MEYQDYREFLASKHPRAATSGIDVAESALPARLFDWQRLVTRWALRRGQAAIWAECGLGKTSMQLSWADQVARHTNKPVLILTPLAVGPQTVREASACGLEARQISRQAEVTGPGLYVTNYQKLLGGHLDPAAYSGVVLDESGILKSYTGKTKRLLIEAFRHTPYRLACTATPAPNDTMELGNHAEFLGVMNSNLMLSRWFINDAANCGTYRLKGHAEKDFWRWVASWACCLTSPADLGFEATNYQLPPLEYHDEVVAAPVRQGEGLLFSNCNVALTATTVHAEMRKTVPVRAARVADLVHSSAEPWIVWCNTNDEADALRQVIPEAVEVRGNHSDEHKEETFEAFSAGQLRVLVTKPSIAGYGLNWQHCAHSAFVGLSYSYEQFYQAVRRTYRFGQRRTCHAHIVTSVEEGPVVATVRQKMQEFDKMRSEMVAATRETTMAEVQGVQLKQVERQTAQGKAWTMHLGDNVEVIRAITSDSVDFTIFSPPFSGLYIYSDAEADMGNSASDEEFFRHFSYLVPELLRVTVPGRLCAVHCKDLPRYANSDGCAGLRDFPGATIALFERHGWTYHSRVTIWKCPVVERERTNNNGLLHKTVKRDSSQIRQGMADYLLVFRKPPLPDDGLLSARPIVRPEGFTGYVGDQDLDPRHNREHPSPYARKKLPSDESIAIWQRYAEPVWWDIDQRDVLNYELARTDRDEKHICPLQLGLIRRAVELWSAPGDLVLSPFAGVGSEGVPSLQQGRRFVGIELKESYWKHACRNLERVEGHNQPTLFAS